MQYIVSYNTDKGIRKPTNQDALLMKVNNTANGRVAFFVVCDGMGGLDQGELASSTVIRGLNEWYEEKLEYLLNENNDAVISSLRQTIYDLNNKILNYATENNVKLGTTLTVFLCIYDNYYIVQVGDSRVYLIKQDVQVLTKDQTLVAREVERGTITKEQAKSHPKRNVLLQCVGATLNMEPVITEGKIQKDTMYMICSDGLYHELLDEEFIKYFSPSVNSNKNIMDTTAKNVVELIKSRGERDNITLLLIKTM